MKNPQTKNPQYYEGILQLRNPNEEALNFVRNQFKNNSKAWIAKVEELKTGIDFYISSNGFLLSLGKKLKKSFKGELKTSRRLHTKDRLTSKQVYRVTVLFRLS
ncbi:hypothetical protein J4209_00360 [Candidatus Woesearchaeota archaeon]|nr:hypothetical protein [Candidatus Woesearchaeota archaeon]